MSTLVAVDTNLVRQPTLRRYVTVLENLRGRDVVVLPTVDRELYRHVAAQTQEYITGLAKRQGHEDERAVAQAVRAGANAAVEWWQREHDRNESIYHFVPERPLTVYTDAMTRLPALAFTDKNRNDHWIYAQAWVHGVDVLASENRHTILTEILDEYFAKTGEEQAPIQVRTLWQHTVATARHENRAIADVALETLLAATIPNAWTADGRKAPVVQNAATMFVENLRTPGNRKEAQRDPDEDREPLAHTLHRELDQLGLERLVERCNSIYQQLPAIARDTESRYHGHVRRAVRATGMNLWER